MTISFRPFRSAAAWHH